MKTGIIIPAHNEEQSIGLVIQAVPKENVSYILVINNGSTDGTRAAAEKAGAIVLDEPVMGYGRACLTGMEYIRQHPVDIVVFLDGDYSDYPAELTQLTAPIINREADFVLGSRVMGNREQGSLPVQSIIGSVIAGNLIQWFWGFRYTDLGPFRAIRTDALFALEMEDRWFGWTVEMQIRALKKGLRVREIPVSYRKRIGKSKVTGTIKGSIMAGIIILKTIGREKLLDLKPGRK